MGDALPIESCSSRPTKATTLWMLCQEATAEAGDGLACTSSTPGCKPCGRVAERVWVHEVVTKLEREVVLREINVWKNNRRKLETSLLLILKVLGDSAGRLSHAVKNWKARLIASPLRFEHPLPALS